MTLRRTLYRGFHRNNGEIAYLIHGGEVYFSGLTDPRKATSTINAAEEVITAICADAHISPQRYTFHDIQTHRGYGKPVGYYVVNELKLKIAGDRISVEEWIEVDRWEFPREYDLGGARLIPLMDEADKQRAIEYGREQKSKLPGIPKEVFEAFRSLVEQ